MNRTVGLIAMATALAALVAGCAPKADSPTAPVGTPTPVLGSPTQGAGSLDEGGSTASPSSVVIADGRHPVIVKSVDLGKREITFDLVVFLTGTAAETEWLKRNPGGSVEDAGLNGY